MFRGKSQQLLGGILIAVLVIGLAGYSITNFGGGTAGNIGSVGETEIGVDAYARVLDRQINATGQEMGEALTAEQAQAMGLDQAALGQLVTRAALIEAARELGLSVDDERVAAAIREIPQFQADSGGFDADAYRFSLRQLGYTVTEFEAETRDDLATRLLRTAIISGVDVPSVMTATMVDYLTSEYEVTWAPVEVSADSVPAPDEADLAVYHEANPAPYTTPELREITYVALTPASLAETIAVDPAEVRAAYDEAGDRFGQPERRLVERLVFPDAEAAQAAADRLSSDEIDFDGLVADRGLTLEDVDLGEVTRGDLGGAADAVFAPEEPGVVGPVDTGLGPALFRVNALLEASETSFEAARAGLEEELRLSRAAREIDLVRAEVADLIAGGASLEDLAAQTPMTLDRVDWTDATTEGLPGDPAFREAAAAITAGDFPALIELEAGGYAALRLDEIHPPELRPLDAVRDQVAADWRDDRRQALSVERADAVAAEIRDGGSMTDAGLAPETDIVTRDSVVDGTPPAFNERVFGAEAGEVLMIDDGGMAIVARVDGVEVPEDDDTAEALADAFARQAAQSLAADLARAFNQAVIDRAGVRIDQNAVQSIVTQLR